MSDERYAGVEAALRARINAVGDATLATAKSGLSLTEIEDIALKVRGPMGEAGPQALVTHQAPVAVPGPVGEQCGREMHDKGLKKRRGVSRSGEGVWERPYSYGEPGRRGFFPPRSGARTERRGV